MNKSRWCSVQFSSVTQLCPTLCDPMNRSMPGLPVHHQLPEFTQTQVHRVSDAIQPSHPLASPSPPAPNPSQHQSLFQWVSSSHEVAKVLEFQLQHQSLQRNPRADPSEWTVSPFYYRWGNYTLGHLNNFKIYIAKFWQSQLSKSGPMAPKMLPFTIILYWI